MVGMGCGHIARHARHFFKKLYIFTLLPKTDTPASPPKNTPPQKHPKTPPKKRKKSFSKNAVLAVRYDTNRCETRPTDERRRCAQRVPPEKVVKTPSHAFSGT
jgi:hypothetical protein